MSNRQLKNLNQIQKRMTFGGDFQLLKHLNLLDICIALCVCFMAISIRDELHEAIQPYFIGYTIILSFWLILQPKSNPGKTHYKLLWTALKFDKNIYFTLDKNTFLDDNKGEDYEV